jgi:beta-N-acetylhexosaminidase
VDQLEKPPADDSGKGLYGLQRDSLINAVKSGEISESRIDQSVYRILKQKLDHGLFKHPYVDESKVASRVGTPAHLAAEQRITDKTTTLVKNDALPLKKAGQKVFVTGYGVATTQTLAGDIGKRGAVTSVLQTGTTPSQATIDQSVAQAKENDVTVVTTNAAWNSTAQQNLVKALVATGKPVIVASVRDAYDIGYFPEVKNYLVTYGYTPASLESLTKVLFGEIAPKGKLPVMIPVAGHPDQTLYPYGYGLSFGK